MELANLICYTILTLSGIIGLTSIIIVAINKVGNKKQ